MPFNHLSVFPTVKTMGVNPTSAKRTVFVSVPPFLTLSEHDLLAPARDMPNVQENVQETGHLLSQHLGTRR